MTSQTLRLLQSLQNILTPDTKGLLAGLGIAIVSYSTLSILSALSIYFFPSRVSTYHHGAEPYALITGASDGIGFALASELSSRGFNIILHGRNAAKLSAVAAHLSSKHPQCHYKILVADAATFPPTAEAYAKLLEPVKHLNITILVNNVGNVGGITNKSIRSVADWPDDEVEALLNLNVNFTLHLTRAMLPHLQQHEPVCIVNCGSVASAGIPYLAHYSGTKAFLKAWSRGLGIELKVGEGRDIEVMHAEIGEVGTPSNPGGANTAFKIDAVTFARALVNRMGWNYGSVTPYWGHLVFSRVLPRMPEWVFARAMGPVMKEMSRGEMRRVEYFEWEGKKEM